MKKSRLKKKHNVEFPNIDVILEFLSEEFPGLPVEDKDDFDLHAHRFRVIEENQICLLKVTKEYASGTDAKTLRSLLRDRNVGTLMRNPEWDYILISRNGLEPFKRE